MRLSGLWLHPEFRKLWAGQATSLLATQFLYLALPLTAVTTLDASPFQMGLVVAMAGIPAVFGLPMGSWVDRRRRKPVIILADVGRAALLAAIPVAHGLDGLTIELIYAVSFGVGAMSILFQIAYRSYLPSVVDKDELVEANSKLEYATSGAGSIGPAAVGFLVQLLTAPFALLFGTGLYSLSALLFRRINVEETVAAETGDSTLDSIREGLGFVRRNRLLLGIATSSATVVAFSSGYEAVSLLYMVNVLELNAGTIGVMFGISSAGLFAGAWLSSRYAKKIGVGNMMIAGVLLVAIGDATVPLAGGPTAVVILIIVSGGVATEAGIVLFNIGNVSIKQAITPDHLQGRVTSVLVVGSRAAVPVGGFLGGALGEWLGLRETMFVMVIGTAMSAVWLLYFRFWKVRDLGSD